MDAQTTARFDGRGSCLHAKGAGMPARSLCLIRRYLREVLKFAI